MTASMEVGLDWFIHLGRMTLVLGVLPSMRAGGDDDPRNSQALLISGGLLTVIEHTRAGKHTVNFLGVICRSAGMDMLLWMVRPF